MSLFIYFSFCETYCTLSNFDKSTENMEFFDRLEFEFSSIPDEILRSATQMLQDEEEEKSEESLTQSM